MLGYFSIKNGKACASAMNIPYRGIFGTSHGLDTAFFSREQFSIETETHITVCSGFVLNASEIAAETATSFAKALSSLPFDVQIMRTLHGAYCIARYKKCEKTLFLSNDLLSKQPLYYSINGNDLLFSTRFEPLVEALKRMGITPEPDPMGISMLINHGYLSGDFTPVHQIHFLPPFRYLIASDKGIKEEAAPLPAPADEDTASAIEKIDTLFAEAVRLQYSKNTEYGYKQLGSLSGGMDSRVLLLKAQQLGFTDDMTFTYSQSGSLDMSIAKSVAEKCHVPNLFFAMDGGDFLADRESFFKGNEGLCTYCGSTGVLEALARTDTMGCGLIHSAVGGGEIFGDILPADGDCAPNCPKLYEYIKSIGCEDAAANTHLRDFALSFPTFNMFRQISDLRANTNFIRTASSVLPACSPFLYEPLFLFLMSLPMKQKASRHLYYAWVDAKDLTLSIRTTDPAWPFRPYTLPGKVIRQWNLIYRSHFMKTGKREMNPFDVWLETNQALKTRLDILFKQDLQTCENAAPDLIGKIKSVYLKGGAKEQLRALTASGVLARIYES